MTLAVNIAQSGANNVSFRNRIINGAMVIDQRNAGASVTPTSGQYTLDRWTCENAQTSKYTVQQNAGSVTPPTGFSNYLGVTSSSAYSVVSGDYFTQIQKIEGFNFADMAWGTASAATVTLSFWVRSSLTGTFGGALVNSAGNRSYPFSYTISSANTWTQIALTIAGDTTGTWVGSTNGVGSIVRFSLGAGSTYSGTAGAWAAGNYVQPTGATSVVGTSGATFYITGVQLEAGTTASPFEYRQYGTELALCQRYYTTIAAATQYPTGYTFSTNRVLCSYFFPATMRAAPTAATSSTFAYFQNGGVATSSAATFSTTLSGSVMLDITVTATANTSGSIANNAAVTLSSEL